MLPAMSTVPAFARESNAGCCACRIDYWAIALSSAAMTRAVYPLANKTPTATATSLCLTPFQPLVVSSTNAIAMEVGTVLQLEG